MKNFWQNNVLSKKLFEKSEHDFGYMDGDGVIQKCYFGGNRMIFLEVKHMNEKVTYSEWLILSDLARIPWESLYDDKSGVFLLRHDEQVNYFEVYKITPETKSTAQLGKPTIYTFKDLYEWFSAKDKDKPTFDTKQKELLSELWKQKENLKS